MPAQTSPKGTLLSPYTHGADEPHSKPIVFPRPPQTRAAPFKSLYRKRAGQRFCHSGDWSRRRASDTALRLPGRLMVGRGFPNSYAGCTFFVSVKGVSQAQSARVGRKGCDRSWPRMPVDPATAHVQHGIAWGAHVSNGGVNGRK